MRVLGLAERRAFVLVAAGVDSEPARGHGHPARVGGLAFLFADVEVCVAVVGGVCPDEESEGEVVY